MIMPAKAMEHLPQLALEEEVQDLFLAGNACRIFGL
jgi:hypothetical protein